MMNLIVLAAVVICTVFVAAWAVSPNLRMWIERPKYRFLAQTGSYDAETCDDATVKQK
jgi:hypothetical protein